MDPTCMVLTIVPSVWYVLVNVMVVVVVAMTVRDLFYRRLATVMDT